MEGLSREREAIIKPPDTFCYMKKNLLIFQAAISVLPNIGSLPIPAHKLKIETRIHFVQGS